MESVIEKAVPDADESVLKSIKHSLRNSGEFNAVLGGLRRGVG